MGRKNDRETERTLALCINTNYPPSDDNNVLVSDDGEKSRKSRMISDDQRLLVEMELEVAGLQPSRLVSLVG